MKEQAADIIGNLTLNTDGFIRTFSLHGVNNMLGNGFEITLTNHNVILKAGIVTHDYKEDVKVKSKLTEINDLEFIKDELIYKRAKHVITEQNRVIESINALKNISNN